MTLIVIPKPSGTARASSGAAAGNESTVFFFCGDPVSGSVLHLFGILISALRADGFFSRAFINVAASGAPVPEPAQFIDIKSYWATNGTHAASPYITRYGWNQKNIVLSRRYPAFQMSWFEP